LVIQRVRTAGSEHVEDQEIFRRLSISADASRFVVAALTESTLARVVGEVPLKRPEPTLRHDGRGSIGYALSRPDGDDGAPLTDYDVIGSAVGNTGMFALEAAEHFNFLCIPPLTREADVGLSVLLVAARFCRERNAMLIVDPPLDWTSAERALQGLREWQFHHENALMYFPRILGFDRLRRRFEQFAPGGAVAGLLARTDEAWPLWSAAQPQEPILRPNYRPVCPVSDAERVRLGQAGVNTLQAVRAHAGTRVVARTLAAGSSGSSDWKYLAARRLALFIVASVERGTRWVVFETNGPELWQRVTLQVEAFLGSLDAAGAFIGREHDEAFFVVCDDRINSDADVRTGTVNVLVGFAALRAGEYHAYLISHDAAGSRTRPVSVNRLETGGRRLDEEMERIAHRQEQEAGVSSLSVIR
ncbi:MAG: hypothetical protein L0271_08720, partial [Gemmatimonadetes bacterium]|nr:hypothetical protein [Gemmatimonadota bacterium]